ncbi:hypothetical protein [Streptomyces morookaense]|uniref:Uncharacterized protein n=1 Tax=Streptomyces morookaense TaxID=1970 RepID=A0A7Y7BB86_STRMO|nr:hypothetical protein [Streptomyces morookaense]NVK82378.1 hypothetical protein [Streptomyces morookaense]GHF54648.1 hypothetical protein GCM10010359_66180 [Streptomyces morookaense]
MSAQPVEPGEGADALIPQPAMTREALREAVRHIRPLNLAQYDRELGEAFDQAVRTGSIGWMRTFLIKWAMFVAVERRPARAAALRVAEQVADDPSSSDEQVLDAQREIAGILAAAEKEIGLG